MTHKPVIATVSTGVSGGVRWELARRRSDPRLAPYVVDMAGYTEASPAPIMRRELPGPGVVVIFELGPPIRVFEVGSLVDGDRFDGGFVAGLCDGFTLTEHAGYQAGVQLNLTPIGARRLLGMPMSELTNLSMSVRDAFPQHRELTAQLADLSDWDARFDLLEAFCLERLAANPLSIGGDVVAWAAHQIEQSGGAIDVGALTTELGYSHKHVIRLFRDHIGVPPKLYARIVRFMRLVEHLRGGDETPLSHLAIDLGYSDQSHLNREVRAFSGLAPRELRGVDEAFGDDVNSVQDVAAR